ncbi:2-oxoisovalerate dehydrogenase subunit alpha [Coccidioides immitis H538.4]|uniref:2-oxoisovalerate dehydrogenase subunit alpha n=1 Tax=Coccidioides immitis H538.4 TaxID=396776 RepID=A0A0J8RGQ3_COCIT|nr:2-oxoisovalerate dehydrogenase subunit alpha [Coccidioides immitis H538.4]
MSRPLLHQCLRSSRGASVGSRLGRVRWGSSISQKPGSDHLRFPGAINSKFTTNLNFINPSDQPAIPTYRVMDSDGVIVDKSRAPNVPDEEVISWYKNMVQALQNPNEPKQIVACYFGEGAASEGDFHAALNIAATRSCPVVFICRNNGYAISTPTLEQYRGDGIASRGVGYGIDTIRVDGNDIFAVREVTKEARRMALENRPILIEAMSYRVSHHSTSDDSFAYRARVEVEDWKRRDNPIIRLRKWMENKGIWNEDLERETREQLRKDVLTEFAAAEREQKPAIKELFTDVYEQMTPELLAQKEELKRIIEAYPNEYDISEYDGGLKGL